MMWWYLSCFR